MGRSTYTEEQRRAAVELYLEHGGAEAARLTGIPKGTIRSWASRGDAATQRAENQDAAIAASRRRWEERRGDLVDRIGEAADLALDQTITALTAADAKVAKDSATTMAILVDKAQLLSGGATGRIATDAEKATAVAEGRERGLRLVADAAA